MKDSGSSKRLETATRTGDSLRAAAGMCLNCEMEVEIASGRYDSKGPPRSANQALRRYLAWKYQVGEKALRIFGINRSMSDLAIRVLVNEAVRIKARKAAGISEREYEASCRAELKAQKASSVEVAGKKRARWHGRITRADASASGGDVRGQAKGPAVQLPDNTGKHGVGSYHLAGRGRVGRAL